MCWGLLTEDGSDIKDVHTLFGYSGVLQDYPGDNKFAADDRFYSAELRELAKKVAIEISNLLGSKTGWSQDQIIRFQALKAFCRAVEAGHLVHGPLLAWAKWSGDDLQDIKDNNEVYLMPVRHGVPFTQYPWTQHAEAALKSTRTWLQNIGEWHVWEQSVARASTEVLIVNNTCYEQNIVERNKALVGAQRPTKVPSGTTLTLWRA